MECRLPTSRLNKRRTIGGLTVIRSFNAIAFFWNHGDFGADFFGQNFEQDETFSDVTYSDSGTTVTIVREEATPASRPAVKVTSRRPAKSARRRTGAKSVGSKTPAPVLEPPTPPVPSPTTPVP